MKRVFCIAIVLGLTVQGLLAATPDTASGSQQTKQPWEWTDAERLAGRFDPAFIKAIRRPRHDPAAGVVANESQNSDWRATISGEVNPELILPFEAFNQLLQGVPGYLPTAEEFRHHWVDPRLVAFGYKEPDAFWKEFETVVHDHVVLARKSYDLSTELQHSTGSEREAIQKQQAGLNTCQSRMDALAVARAHFGRENFDRLLYAVAAPGVNPGVRSATEEEYHLAWLETGCQSEAATLLVSDSSTATPARPSPYWARSASPAEKAPWEWTDAERMAFRLDPNVVEVQTPTSTGGARSQKLNGATHPEAIFPFELFDILLLNESASAPSFRDSGHDRTNALLFASGVKDPEAWWSELDPILSPYAAPLRENHEVAERLQRADRAERVGLEKQLADLRRAQCRSTAQGLNAAREHYGRETFDRFLYMVVAPGLQLIKWAGDDLAKQLAYQARGCGSSTNSTVR